MKLTTRREYHEPGQTWTLYPIADMHIGSRSCQKAAMFDVRERIRNDPFARWVGLGDYAEWISVKDPRFNGDNLDPDIVRIENVSHLGTVYLRWLHEFFAPIAEKCWGMGDGNHEQKWVEHNAMLLTPDLLRSLGLAAEDYYLGWTSISRVIFTDCSSKRTFTLRMYCDHGWQAGRKAGAKINNMRELPGLFPGNHLYLRGHSHDRFADRSVGIVPNATFSKFDEMTYYVSHVGGFLRTYANNTVSYAERAGYPPTCLGPITFSITFLTATGTPILAAHV